MRRFVACLLFSASTYCASTALAAPDTRLEPGVAVAGTLEAGSGAVFEASLDAERFVYLEVDQVSVDVRVVVRDPQGKALLTEDGTARGAEPVQFETTGGGTYRLEIQAKDDQSGAYAVELLLAEPIATAPERRLEQLLTRYGGPDTPGAVVAIVRDGEVAHARAVGMANLAYGIPFERNTVSNIGSVSKQFTAMAVVMLAESGALSLDDDVRNYFPSLPDLGEVVTVRQLLNHSNGYREFLNLFAMTGLRLDLGDYIDRGSVLDMLERQPYFQDPPGSRFNYNNSAYTLAALLVEQLTETAFDKWVAQHLFAPLGMSRTRIRSFTGEIVPGAADGYLPADLAPWRQAVDLGGGGGATMGPGGIYTTVDDLARWMGNLETADVGGAAAVAQLTTPTIATPHGQQYGLGFVIGEHRGLPYVEHGGADTAHRAHLLYFPSLASGVIALSNNGNFDSKAMVFAAAEAFFSEHLVAEAPIEAETPMETAAADAQLSDLEPSAFARVLGLFEFVEYPGVVLEIARDENRLVLIQGDNAPLELTPVAANRLRVSPDSDIEFDTGGSGPVERLVLRDGGELTARRLDPWVPSAGELREFTGRYYSNELLTAYEVRVKDSGLVISHPRLEDMALKPKTNDAFSTSGVLNAVAFERSADGEVIAMHVSNVRTLNVQFEKLPGQP